MRPPTAAPSPDVKSRAADTPSRRLSAARAGDRPGIGLFRLLQDGASEKPAGSGVQLTVDTSTNTYEQAARHCGPLQTGPAGVGSVRDELPY